MIAILHEGNAKKTSDNKLLKLLIENLSLDEKKVRFFGLGSKSNFFNKDFDAYKELITDIKEEIISKVLFVVDADYKINDSTYGGFDNTSREIIDIRNTLKIYEISDLYITCDFDTKDGYLESLILSSVPPKQKECIEDFLECSEFKSKENDKAILNQIYNNAYPNAPYDFSSEKFDILKQKLKNLFKEEANDKTKE
jgi:hypothetical protein